MTAQSHIDKIAKALLEVEKNAEATRMAAKATERAVRRLHGLLDDAQQDYKGQHGNVVPFSGGTDKPPPGGDEPLDPIP